MNQVAIDCPKVLVVDDRQENLKAMEYILKHVNGQVVCASSGNDALKCLLKDEYAVVLLDVQMPDMNGFETAEIIRNNESTHNLPIIFVTAISKEQHYVDHGYELGAVDYLFKPFDPKILRYKVSVFIDLFRQRHLSVDLARKNQLILDSVREGVIGIDISGTITFSNPAAEELLCSEKRTLVHTAIHSYISEYGSEIAWVDSPIYETCMSGDIFSRSGMRFVSQDQRMFPVECIVSSMKRKDNTLEGFVMVFSDITDRVKAEQKLAELAEYDPLTGLANRRLFYRLLPIIISKSKRLGHDVALLFIDVDHFKAVNDTLGHLAGDLLLTQVAGRLKSCTRESDTVVRLGGDEFTLILEGDVSEDVLSSFAANLIEKMSEPFQLNHNKVQCTVSVGISVSSQGDVSAAELIRSADVAMYDAKTQGRNTFKFFDEGLSQKISYRSKIETSFGEALNMQELYLVYQPKISLLNNRLIGFESLLRWQSGQHGNVSPADFIPVAEESGHINELGLWVLEEACQQLRQWLDAGLLTKGSALSVNFSTKQLNNPQFLLKLEEVLGKWGVEPSFIDVELTETTLISNPDAIIPLLRVLSEMGMTISVDDFGTGYSSLNYLKLLPIHNLKIDKSFISDLFRDANSEIITRSIINLAHNLGLKVIAEGIETREQKEFLEHYNCDVGQGYFFSKPINAHAATEILNKL